VELDDLVQVACVALLRAAELHDPKVKVPFAPYAMKGILWALWDFLKHQPKQEVSLDAPIDTTEDGEALTLGDAVLTDEESDPQADENEGRVYCLLADLIQRSPELTPRERKILELGYLKGMTNDEIRRRVGPPTNIGVESAIAIRKLRTIMRRRGYQALPPEAPVLHASGGRPPRL
jgi:RNA polymerase sigma factor (sigma-70 family)